jgi:hypothetical protein
MYQCNVSFTEWIAKESERRSTPNLAFEKEKDQMKSEEEL